MQATLLAANAETTLWLECAFAYEHISLTVVPTLAALERAARHAELTDFLIVDCSLDRPEDVEVARQVIRCTGLDVCIVYARPNVLDELEPFAQGAIRGLDYRVDWPTLLVRLRKWHKQATVRGGGSAKKITIAQRQVWALVAQNMSDTKIASKLSVSTGTVKKSVERIKRKLRVRTRGELEVAFRWLAGDEGLAELAPLTEHTTHCSTAPHRQKGGTVRAK